MSMIANAGAYDRSELGGYQMRLQRKKIEQSGVGAATGIPICWSGCDRDHERERGVALHKSGISDQV